MATERRGLTAQQAMPVASESKAQAKPAKAAQTQRPWWWYVTPAGIKNEVDYRKKQLDRINKDRPYAGRVGMLNLYYDTNGSLTTANTSQRDILRGAAQLPLNAALLGTNLVQRVANGNKSADPRSTPVGRGVAAVERGLNTALGLPQPEKRKQEDLFWQQMGSDFASAAVGAAVGAAAIPGTAFTSGAFSSLSPVLQQALRWTAGTGTESIVSTALSDNTRGNVANLTGGPFAVNEGDDMVSSAFKSLLPNAGAEIGVGLLGLGLGKGFRNVTRRIKEGRAVSEAESARRWTVEQGIQSEAEQGYGFRQEPEQAKPEAAAEPAPQSAPATQKDAEAQLLGPEEEAPEYDPSLPEVDLAVQAANRLDDQQLQAAAAGEGPVLPVLEQQLQEQAQGFQVQEGLELEMLSAPTQVLAEPMVPYEAQWQQLDNSTLLSLAAPQNNPALFEQVQRLSGREYGEFTRADVIEGLGVLKGKGMTLLPNRVQDGALVYDVNSIAVDPGRFQFKDNVNAQGQQKGNSLEGVSRWNTDAEGAIQIWNDPMDGKPYVVNGHNRLAKAKELGVPSIRAEELLAGTAEQARAQGAISNIAQGAGTAFDAAKVIRERGITDLAGLDDAGIPLKGGNNEPSLGVKGLALSKLPDNLFQAAVNGELPMGRALALGESGLDPEGMTRVYQLAQGRDMTERGFVELTQMASTAPKVESDQMGLFGPEVIDTTVIKAELAAKVRAELGSSRRLLGMAGKQKNATKLAEKAGATVDAGQARNAADVVAGVIEQFDQTKYMAETPISQLLNEGAAEIAAGAKPAVISKRILAQLEKAAEMSPPAPKAQEPAAPVEEPMDPGVLPAQRDELKKQIIQRAIDNGEVRPSAAPLPELPDPPRNLDDPVELLKDELRLADHYGQQKVIRQQVELDATREAMGYDDMPLEEKKANGMLDSWSKEPVTPEEKAEYARYMRQKAEANGDTAAAREWREAERRIERARIATAQAGLDASQQDMFGAGQYDTTAPLLNQPAGSSVKLDTNANAAKVARRLGEYNLDKGRWGITEQQWLDTFKRIGGVPDWYELVGGQANWEKLMQGFEMPEAEARIKSLVQGSAEASQPAAPSFTFPANLAKSKPRYGMATVQFANDYDRAAYILRDASKKSKGEDRLIAALEEAGFDIAEVRAHGKKVHQALKDQVKTQTGSAAAPQSPVALQVDSVADIASERLALKITTGVIPELYRSTVSEVIAEAVSRIAGDQTTLALHSSWREIINPPEHGGGSKKVRMGGQFEIAQDIVNIYGMLERNPADLVSTAYHESWHRVQFKMLNTSEMEVMDSVFGRARVGDYSGFTPRQKATIERQAYAFQTYAELRTAGVRPADALIREAVVEALDTQFPRKAGDSWGDRLTGKAATVLFQGFDRLVVFMERLNNAVRGRGFTSFDDVFEKAFSGELAKQRGMARAVEVLEQDAMRRAAKLHEWRYDNPVFLRDIDQGVASIDAQINALKAKAIAGGC